MDGVFLEKTLDRDGCRLHYWISESPGRPWLMMLHGAGTNHLTFQYQYPVFIGNYSVISMDTRGAGLSRPSSNQITADRMVDDTLAVLDCESIKQTVVIGHSLGGNIAQEIAYRHPERVSSLVFIDCTCNTMRLTPLERFAVWCSPAIFALYPQKTLIRQSAEVSAVKSENKEYLVDALGAVGKKDFSRIMNAATGGFLHYDEDYRIPKPILLLCGEKDGTGNIRKCAPRWAAREPQCEFHMIEGAGHCAHMDAPDRCNDYLSDFLKRHYDSKNSPE